MQEIWKDFEIDFSMSNTGFVFSKLTKTFLVPTATNSGALRITRNQKSIYLRKVAFELFGEQTSIVTLPEQIRLRNLELVFSTNQPDEVWKEVGDFYLVSNYGRLLTIEKGFELHGNIDGRGYLKAKVSLNGKPTFTGIYRLAAMAFIPNPENKPQVNHIDGNKLNNHISNLEWATSLENMQHADANGLRENCRVKLTESDIPRIRRLIAEGETYYQIGKIFNVDPTTIRCIDEGRSWKHV